MYPGSGREWIAPFPAALRAGETWPVLPPSGRRCRAAPLAFPGSDRGIAGRGQSAGSAACSRRAAPRRARKLAGAAEGGWDSLPPQERQELHHRDLW